MSNLVAWVDDHVTSPVNDVWNQLEEDPKNVLTLALDPTGLLVSTGEAAELLTGNNPVEWAMDKTGFTELAKEFGESNIGTYAAMAVAAWYAAGAAAASGGAAAETGAGAAETGGLWNSVSTAAQNLGSGVWESVSEAGTALQELLVGTSASGGELGAWDAFVSEGGSGGIWGLVQSGLSKGYTAVKDMAGFLGISESALIRTGVMGALALVGNEIIGDVPALTAPPVSEPGSKLASFDQYLWLMYNPGKTPQDYANANAEWNVWKLANPDKDPIQSAFAHEVPDSILQYNWSNIPYTWQNPGQAAEQTYPAIPDHVIPQAANIPAGRSASAVDYTMVNNLFSNLQNSPPARVPVENTADTIAGLWSGLLNRPVAGLDPTWINSFQVNVPVPATPSSAAQNVGTQGTGVVANK